MDFAALPPEINSGRMYAGPGPGSLLAAAVAWEQLGAELQSAAAAYRSVVSGLTGVWWSGPSSVAMAAAAAPYAAWMSASAARCGQAGEQARAAASAFAAAFAATVPPAAVAANRAQLTALIATNFLGQNTAAIAATEAQYAQMWAQDAAAMYDYAGSAATATQLAPFTAPTPAADADAQPDVSQLLQGLAGPAQGLLPSLLPDSLVAYLGLIAPYTASIGTVNLATRLASQESTREMHETVDRIALAVGAAEPAPPAPTPAVGGVTVTAEMGRAASVRALSVPQAWTATAPPKPIQTVAQVAAGPGPNPGAVVALGDGQEIALSELALAGMAGNVMTRSVRRGNATYTITVTKNPPEPGPGYPAPTR